jgi:hypothetical protein
MLQPELLLHDSVEESQVTVVPLYDTVNVVPEPPMISEGLRRQLKSNVKNNFFMIISFI